MDHQKYRNFMECPICIFVQYLDVVFTTVKFVIQLSAPGFLQDYAKDHRVRRVRKRELHHTNMPSSPIDLAYLFHILLLSVPLFFSFRNTFLKGRDLSHEDEVVLRLWLYQPTPTLNILRPPTGPIWFDLAMQVLRCSIWRPSICNPQIFIHACVTMSWIAFPKTIVVADEGLPPGNRDIDSSFFLFYYRCFC